MLLRNKLKKGNPYKSALYCCLSGVNSSKTNPKVHLLQYGIDHNLKFEFFNEVETPGNQRRVKRDLIKKLRNGEYRELIVFKLDHWSNFTSELSQEISELSDLGIRFISLYENIGNM